MLGGIYMVANNYTTASENTLLNSYSNAQQSNTQNINMQNTQTVIGVFNNRQSAETAISSLRSQGFSNEEINLISKKSGTTQGNNKETYDDDIMDGTLTGSTIGGIGGLIVGSGALMLPGIGPILAVGPIAAAIGGAIAGGVAGGLIDWGIPAEASERYEENVKQGDILTVIRTTSSKVNSAAQVLRQNGAKDVETH